MDSLKDLWNSLSNIWLLDSAHTMHNCFYLVFDHEIPAPILEVIKEKEIKIQYKYSE